MFLTWGRVALCNGRRVEEQSTTMLNSPRWSYINHKSKHQCLIQDSVPGYVYTRRMNDSRPEHAACAVNRKNALRKMPLDENLCSLYYVQISQTKIDERSSASTI